MGKSSGAVSKSYQFPFVASVSHPAVQRCAVPSQPIGLVHWFVMTNQKKHAIPVAEGILSSLFIYKAGVCFALSNPANALSSGDPGMGQSP